MFVCLFLLLLLFFGGCYVPLENWIFQSYGDVTITGERLQLIFALYSALMVMSSEMWHGVSVYNGHLRVPMTLKPVAKR